MLKIILTNEVMLEGIVIEAIVPYDHFEEGEEEKGFEYFENIMAWINIDKLNKHYGFD